MTPYRGTMVAMNDQMYDEVFLERQILAQFGVRLEIESTIASRFPIARTGEATLFLTDKKQLYLYITSQSKLLLADVRKIVSRAGLVADGYLPPKGDPHYFDEVGTRKFRETFPGRSTISQQDIAYYRTLAPYSPALVQIAEVKDGIVYQFDGDSTTGWRQTARFMYRRIRTS